MPPDTAVVATRVVAEEEDEEEDGEEDGEGAAEWCEVPDEAEV